MTSSTKDVQEFVKPIKERWVFHFLLSPKTSPLDKPEWYLDQTIKTINQHVDRAERELGASGKKEFILIMVGCVMKRLKRDMKKIRTGLDNLDTEVQLEAILIHTYNEVVAFICKYLKPLLGREQFVQLDDAYDLMSFFSDQDILERIIEVEWEHGNMQLEKILKIPDLWNTVLDEEYHDEYKIPKCIDKLIMLLSAMKDRIECFKHEDCQFKLIELQCCLTEKLVKDLKEKAKSSSVLKNIMTFPHSLITASMSAPVSDSKSKTIALKNGLNFLKLVLDGNHIVPISVFPVLDYSLRERIKSLSEECTVD